MSFLTHATKTDLFFRDDDAEVEIVFTKSQIIAGIPGTFFCVWYVFKKHWLANNTLGLAFSIQVCENGPQDILEFTIRGSVEL